MRSSGLNDFWHALQSLGFSDSLQLVYKVSVWVELALVARDPCRGPPTPTPSQVLGISSPRLFSMGSVFFPRQNSGYFRKGLMCQGSSACDDASKCQLTREIGSRRASEHAASRTSTLGLSSPLPSPQAGFDSTVATTCPTSEKEKARL